MITGNKPLTAVHVARDVEIVDRDALILDLRENPAHEAGEFIIIVATTPSDVCRRFGLAHWMKLRLFRWIRLSLWTKAFSTSTISALPVPP